DQATLSVPPLRLLPHDQPLPPPAPPRARSVDQPHPPIPHRGPYLAVSQAASDFGSCLAGAVQEPGHPGRRAPARRPALYRSQPVARPAGGRSCGLSLVEFPAAWGGARRSAAQRLPRVGGGGAGGGGAARALASEGACGPKGVRIGHGARVVTERAAAGQPGLDGAHGRAIKDRLEPACPGSAAESCRLRREGTRRKNELTPFPSADWTEHMA